MNSNPVTLPPMDLPPFGQYAEYMSNGLMQSVSSMLPHVMKIMVIILGFRLVWYLFSRITGNS